MTIKWDWLTSRNARDSQAIGTYLTQSYGQYLEKMLEIGLGASTMSYTKFNLGVPELSAKTKLCANVLKRCISI